MKKNDSVCKRMLFLLKLKNEKDRNMIILLILSSVLLNCGAQLLIRKGMLQIGEMPVSSIFQNMNLLIANVWLWLAMLCYAVSILLWMSVLSKAEVSFAYPFLSVGYVLSAVFGYVFFSESITTIRIAGIVVICIGVILISRS